MRQIPLTKGKTALVDDADFEELNKFRWFAEFARNKWYARRKGARAVSLNGRKLRPSFLMHRQIMGNPPMMVDHKNGNGLDNQKDNLRLATNSQNQANTGKIQSGGSSKFRGVKWEKARGKWFCQIRVSGKNIFVGRFAEELDAAKAVDEAAKKHFGEFAWSNLPPG